MDRPAPPEATLIRTARKAAGLSIEAAAEQAGALSFVRWSQIENGYESRGGQRRPIRGTDTHIAHMAHVVGISPERLEHAGRPDAAVVLREIILQEQLAAERDEESGYVYGEDALDAIDNLDLPANVREGMKLIARLMLANNPAGRRSA